jgi:predicted ATPase
MPLLDHVTWRRGPPGPAAGFPFTVPAIATLTTLDLSAPVTFFVGENGSGKSTLLEGIAAATDLPALGAAADVWRDDSLAAAQALGRALRASWRHRTRHGFFLRAEDFFGWLRQRARDDARMERERAEADGGAAARGEDEAEADPDGARHVDELRARRHLAAYDRRSHGEGFLDLFAQRFDGPGLYLLDEPETPLSPRRQLALLALILDAVRAGAQFVVATHSPILLAFPGARIYGFDEAPVRAVAYEALEHVTLTRDFLAAPERFIRHLT